MLGITVVVWASPAWAAGAAREQRRSTTGLACGVAPGRQDDKAKPSPMSRCRAVAAIAEALQCL